MLIATWVKAAQLLKKYAKKFKIAPKYTITKIALWPLWITCGVIGKKWASMTLAFGALINIAGNYKFHSSFFGSSISYC